MERERQNMAEGTAGPGGPEIPIQPAGQPTPEIAGATSQAGQGPERFQPRTLSELMRGLENEEINRRLAGRRMEDLTDEEREGVYVGARQAMLERLGADAINRVGRRRGEGMGAEEMREKRLERIVVVSPQTGLEREFYWPKDYEAKIALMRNYLNQIEDSLSAEGLQSQRLFLDELILVLPALQEGRVEKWEGESDAEFNYRVDLVKKLGTAMYREFYRRLHFHGAYVQYWGASNAEGVAGAISSLYLDIFNFLLRDAPYAYKLEDSHGEEVDMTSSSDLLIWQSLQEYEKRAVDFLRASPEEKGAIREEIKNAVWGNRQRNDHTGYSLASAQVMAERIWEISLRRFKHERLVDEKGGIYDDRYEEVLQKALDEGKDINFLGDAKGGNFPARRLAAIRMRLWSQAKPYRLFMKLVKGIDFNDRDLISLNVADIEGFLVNQFRELYLSKKPALFAGERDARAAAHQKAARDAQEFVENLVGVRKQGTSWQHGRDLDLTKMVFNIKDLDRLNIPEEEKAARKAAIEKYVNDSDLQILFKEGTVDFYWLNPPGANVPRYIANPEKLRDALEAVDGYLRKPSDETLVKFGSLLHFLGTGQYSRIKTLITNFAQFIRSPDARKAHLTRADIGTADNIITKTGRALELSVEEMDELGEKVFGKGPWVDVRLLASKTNASSALFALFWELFTGTVKSAASVIK